MQSLFRYRWVHYLHCQDSHPLPADTKVYFTNQTPRITFLNEPLGVVFPEHGQLFTEGFPLKFAPSLPKRIPHLFTVPDHYKIWYWIALKTWIQVMVKSCHLCMCSVHISSKWLIKLGIVSVAGKKKGEDPSRGHRSRLSEKDNMYSIWFPHKEARRSKSIQIGKLKSVWINTISSIAIAIT